MSGKCSPSLRVKPLYKVEHSNLSQTDKNCIKAVFDRFEEQQAEIERLEEENKEVHSNWKKLKQSYDDLDFDIKTEIGRIKAEAVKEFAERLKALFPSDNEPYQYWEIHEGADNLVKERVGDAKEVN